MGGYDCCFPGNWEFTAPLEEDERQTNNRAELKAAIAAILKVTPRTVFLETASMSSMECRVRHINGVAMVDVGRRVQYLTPCYGKHYCRQSI